MKRIAAAFFIWASCTAFALTPAVSITEMPLGGLSSLSVYCDVRSAAVRIDSIYTGFASLTIDTLSPGIHTVVVQAEGYRDFVMSVTLAPNTRTTIAVTLLKKTGFIDIALEPPEARAAASCVYEGRSYPAGFIELPAGRVTLSIRSFGFIEQTLSAFIHEDRSTRLAVKLLPAHFVADKFALSHTVFNPKNAGVNASTTLSFFVSAPSTGSVTIYDSSGLVVSRHDFGTFSSWKQEYVWEGRNEKGEALADGAYRIEVSVGDDGRYSYTAEALIDSRLVITPKGFCGPLEGTMYAPNAFAPASSGLRFDTALFAYGRPSARAVTGGAAVSIGGSYAPYIDGGLSVETTGTAAALRIALRGSIPLRGIFGFSGMAEGRISEAAPGDPSWLRAGCVFGAGTPFIYCTLMPYIGGYWENASGKGLKTASPSARAGLSAAFGGGNYVVGAAVSLSLLSTAFGARFGLASPIECAAELRFAAPALPLHLRLFSSLGFALPHTGAPQAIAFWNAGIGITGFF